MLSLGETRYAICFNLAKCLFKETNISVHFYYTGINLYAEIPYTPPVVPKKITENVKNYLAEVFDIMILDREFDEHKLADNSYVRNLRYKVNEELWENIQVLLKLKGY